MNYPKVNVLIWPSSRPRKRALIPKSPLFCSPLVATLCFPPQIQSLLWLNALTFPHPQTCHNWPWVPPTQAFTLVAFFLQGSKGKQQRNLHLTKGRWPGWGRDNISHHQLLPQGREAAWRALRSVCQVTIVSTSLNYLPGTPLSLGHWNT